MDKKTLELRIARMSYYNAAEGRQWTAEKQARKEFREQIAREVAESGMTMDEFKTLYNSCEKHLTSIYDFTHSMTGLGGE